MEAFQRIPDLIEIDRQPFGPVVKNAVKTASIATLETIMQSIMANEEVEDAIKKCSFLQWVCIQFTSLQSLCCWLFVQVKLCQ